MNNTEQEQERENEGERLTDRQTNRHREIVNSIWCCHMADAIQRDMINEGGVYRMIS